MGYFAPFFKLDDSDRNYNNTIVKQARIRKKKAKKATF